MQLSQNAYRNTTINIFVIRTAMDTTRDRHMTEIIFRGSGIIIFDYLRNTFRNNSCSEDIQGG